MATTAAFPNQQYILNHIHGHPSKFWLTEDPFIARACGPGSIEKVATYFAGKKMDRCEIQINVVRALTDGQEDEQLFAAIRANLIIKNAQPGGLSENMSAVNTQMEKITPNMFDKGVITYEIILADLFDKAAAIQQSPSQTWETLSEKDVQNLTANQ